MALGISFAEIMAEFDNVDAPDVLDRVPESRALRAALEMTYPQNWWGAGLDRHDLFAIANEDGIPVAWTPPAAVLKELVAAQTGSARRAVLRARSDDIIEHCAELVKECWAPEVADPQHLVTRAIDAFRSGHHESAMSLAVSVGESLAVWSSRPHVTSFDSKAQRNAWETGWANSLPYGWVTHELTTLIDPALPRHDLTRAILIAPIQRFYTPWRREWGTPPPKELSRHVAAHQPTREHFTIDNALVSMMLVTSLLWDQHSWAMEVREPEEVALDETSG